MPKERASRPRRSVRSSTRASTASSNAVASDPVVEEVREEPGQAAQNLQQTGADEFSQVQLNKIAEMVNNAVRNNLTEVASRAARTALDLARSAPTNVPSPTLQQAGNSEQLTTPTTSSTSLAAAINSSPFASQSSHGVQSSGFTPEIPTTYVRSIQMGEFFYLSKLLPENLLKMSLASENDGNDVSFVLGPNQELKLKKNNRKVEISNISDWTLAFTTYMKVVLEKFPHRSHKLINYLDIIQDAARYQRSFTWLIYDRLFRYKASNNKSINWGVRDNKLWIRLSTMSQEQLMVDYPMVVNDSVFNNGPSKYVSGGSSAKRDELCHSLTGDIRVPGFVSSFIGVTKRVAWETTPELDAQSFKAHQEQAVRQAANGAQAPPGAGGTTQAATPVNVDRLEKELMDYPDGIFARTLCSQLRVGARIGYRGPRFFRLSKNLPTAKSNPEKISRRRFS